MFSSSTVALCVILISAEFKLFIYFYTIFYLSSYHSRPPCAIFTTSGWPLLTHHGRPLSPTGFSSRVKNDNRHPEGCEVSHRNGWCPDLLSSAFAYIAHLWCRTRNEGKRYSLSRRVRTLIKMHEKRAAAVGITRY